MKPAKKVVYSDTLAYDKVVDLMRQRAAEDGAQYVRCRDSLKRMQSDELRGIYDKAE